MCRCRREAVEAEQEKRLAALARVSQLASMGSSSIRATNSATVFEVSDSDWARTLMRQAEQMEQDRTAEKPISNRLLSVGE